LPHQIASPSLPFADLLPLGEGINCPDKLPECVVLAFHGTQPDFHAAGWMAPSVRDALEPTPIEIDISQIVPNKKVEEGSRLDNSEANQKTWQSPSSAMNSTERGAVVLSMEIPSLTCEMLPRKNA
jgi:hypothetical protein